LNAAAFITAPSGFDTGQTIQVLGSSVNSTRNGDSANTKNAATAAPGGIFENGAR